MVVNPPNMSYPIHRYCVMLVLVGIVLISFGMGWDAGMDHCRQVDQFFSKMEQLQEHMLLIAPEELSKQEDSVELRKYARDNTPSGMYLWGIIPMNRQVFIVYGKDNP